MENETLKKSKTQKDRFLQSLNLAEINKNNNNYESIFDYCKNRKNSVVAKISNHFSNKKAKKKYNPIISEDAYIIISSDDDIGLDSKNNNNVISQPPLMPEPIQNNNISETNQSQILTTANNTEEEEEAETESLQNNNNPIEPVQTSSLYIPNETKSIKILHRVSISSLESSLADEHISQLVSNKPVSLNDSNSSSSDSDDNDDDRLVSFKNKWCVCDKVISTLNDKKMCDCGQWYHLSCLGYSKEESERFNDKKTDENLKFTCPVCKNDQKFIQKYKQVIEFRKKKYFTQRSSSSNEEEDDDDDDDDEGDEEDEDEDEEKDEYYNKNQMSCSESESSSSEYNSGSRKRNNNNNKKINLVNSSKKKPMVSELSEKDQRDKIEKLIKSQKQPNQTRLIDNPKSFKRKPSDSGISNKSSSSKSFGLTSQKSLIDKLTTKKEQNKMATNNNKKSCKQCLACKKSFLMNRSVPNKVVQEQFLETSDKLQLNWKFSLYCDDKCINKYIEIKLNEREKYLAEKSPIKNDLTDESKRTHIFLYDNNINHSFINVNKKSNEDVKKEIYKKISVQPKFYIVDLNNLQELLNENKIKLPDQIKIFKKVTIFQPQTNNNNISKTVDSNLNSHKVLRSISTPEPPSTVSTSNSKTSVHHESGAGDERTGFKNTLLKLFKSRLDTDSELNISDSILNDLIDKIEMAFHNHFDKDLKGFKQKFTSICLNIKEKKNNFYSKILTEKILPEQLPTITADEMNEEKAKERKTEEEVNLKQIKLGSEEINYSILHRLKKTHKGEIEIENTFDISESLINQNLEKSDGDMSKNNGSSSMAASTISDGPTITTTSPLSSSFFYNRTLSMPVVDNNNVHNRNMLTLNKKTVEQTSKRTLSTESNENTNSKRSRHGPNFESDEDDESTASKIIINSSSLLPLNPIIELNTTSSKRPSIDNSSNDINIPEIFNLNSNYIAPRSPPLLLPSPPPITATQTTSKPNWSGQLFLKSSDYKTCVHAKLIPTDDQDSPAQAFEKLLINSLISLKIEFNFIKKQKNFHKNLTFYNYLKKIKNDLNGLAFLEITSNGLEKNSLSYGHADKSEFILMEDKASFFHFKNNFLKDVEESNIIAYEYKIPDELDKFIGYFYVLVLKKKLEDNSKWFPENLSIPLDRKEDVVLGVFIDKKCKNYQKEAFIHQHSSKNSPTGNAVNENEKQQQQQQIQPLTDNGGPKPKPKPDQLNSTAISSKSHVDLNKPNNNVNRDPRLERQRSKQVDSNQNKACTETTTQKSIETTKTTEQSNIQPILKDIRIVEESIVSQKSNIEQPTTTTGYQELDSNTERSDFFNHIEKTLNNLDKNNLDLIQFELMRLTLFENITTSTEKQILLERYSKDFPAFEVMIRAAKEYMPPNETWQGKSKEAFENLIDLHKKNAENKCYHNFTFHNEEWNSINSDSFKIPKIDFENNKCIDNVAEKKSFTDNNNFNKQSSHFQHQSRNSSHFNQNNYNKNNYQFRRKSTSQTRNKDKLTFQNSKTDS